MSIYFDSNTLFKNAYKGTFAMDEFNHIDMRKFDKCLIIFNSITRDMQTMGHWLALYSKRLKDNTIYVTFFDSFGLSITYYNPILQNYIKKLSPYIKKFDFNTFPLQSNNSYVCGAYVCFIAEKLVLGQYLKEICDQNFKKNNRKYNDLQVVRFIKQRWYKNGCDAEFCVTTIFIPSLFNKSNYLQIIIFVVVLFKVLITYFFKILS